MYVQRKKSLATVSDNTNLKSPYGNLVGEDKRDLYEILKYHEPSFLMEFNDYIVIGTSPKRIFQAKKDETIVLDLDGRESKFPKRDFFKIVDEYLKEKRPCPNNYAPFDGGLLGYIGYDIISDSCSSSPFPDAFLFEPGVYCVADKTTGKIISSNQRAFFDELHFETAFEAHGYEDVPFKLESIPSKEDFISMVSEVLERIKKGEATQVVLSRQIKSKDVFCPLSLYKTLKTVNPSPYMFIMNFDGKSLIGSSPELLLGIKNGVAVTRPIAGTRRRGKDLDEDNFFEMEMLFDDKEREEHMLLLELSMEEFRGICLNESIKVSKYFEVERYSKVMHLVSQVEGKLRPDISAIRALQASFPAGTVTGTPKEVAIKIIGEAEPFSRGPYGGAIGYVGFNGNLEMSIAIRTFMQTDEGLTIQAGAGIVPGSDPKREFLETQNKAAGLIETLKIAKTRRDSNA